MCGDKSPKTHIFQLYIFEQQILAPNILDLVAPLIFFFDSSAETKINSRLSHKEPQYFFFSFDDNSSRVQNVNCSFSRPCLIAFLPSPYHNLFNRKKVDVCMCFAALSVG